MSSFHGELTSDLIVRLLQHNWAGNRALLVISTLDPTMAQLQSLPGPVCGAGGGHVQWSVVRDLSSVIVLIDSRLTNRVEVDQLAGYVAMMGLAEIRADVKVGDAPTILRLFTNRQDAPAHGLSNWDVAYLSALYHTDQRDKTQLLAIGQMMMKGVAAQ